MPTNLTTDQFIEKAIKIHGNQFCYDKTIYVDRKTKVEIFCNKCKVYFWQTPQQHIYAKNGCKHCASNILKASNKKSNIQFLEDAKAIHGDNFSYLTPYINAHTKITIQHKKCGFVFRKTPKAHLTLKQGCPKCGVKKRSAQLRKSHAEFVMQANTIHNDQYNYLSKYKNDASKIVIEHKKCGYIFKQKASSHLQGNGCPECSSSKGERLIKGWLEDKNIPFLYQHKFSDCINPKTQRCLIFDFYLPEHNTIIEFDGPQHYKPFRFYGQSEEIAEQAFIECKFRDSIKNDYCKRNNLELIRINFTYNKKFKDKIEQVLLDII